MNIKDVLEGFPPAWPQELQPRTRERALVSGRTIVVLDDDPTGTQTVYDVPVITTWTTDHIRKTFEQEIPLIYILTNSRSMAAADAKRVNEEVARALISAREATGRDFAVVSRSDSTLRGYFPLETDVLAEVLGLDDAPVLLIPFFEEGGRLTLEDVHYVVENGHAMPASETPFAGDAVFGFAHSNLRDWAEEKTGGRVKAADVHSVSLKTIREGGPTAVATQLLELPPGAVCVINAGEMRDMEVVAAAIYDAWEGGRQFLFRTAASIVRALGGLEKRLLLEREEMALDTGAGGLIVVGSHVPKSTRQLEVLLASHEVEAVEISVSDILRGALQPSDVAAEVDSQLRSGRHVVLFTSRTVELGRDDEDNLRISRTVSEALVETVAALGETPKFLIAKGGITSSDIASKALRVAQATVMGQLLPGVPVWRLGEETSIPGLGYVVFPGNVGDDNALLEATRRLSA